MPSPKIKKTLPHEPATMTVSNCHFEMNNAPDEHTRAAVEALANAARANADAIAAAARALGGANGAPQTCISINSPSLQA